MHHPLDMKSLNCIGPSNTDYCVEVGYNRDKPPPNPPLNISMTLAISVRSEASGQSGMSHPAKMDLNKKLGPKPGSVQTMLFDA